MHTNQIVKGMVGPGSAEAGDQYQEARKGCDSAEEGKFEDLGETLLIFMAEVSKVVKKLLSSKAPCVDHLFTLATLLEGSWEFAHLVCVFCNVEV